MLPTNVESVPMVAELPTCQKTLHALAPLISNTLEALAVVRVLPILKRKTLAGFPWPSRVRVPVKLAEDVKQYTPSGKVRPTRSVLGLLVQGRPAISLYAVVTSLCACKATASAAWVAPFTVPGGKPVIAVPGLTPRSPVSVVGPVLVTVEPPSTAKLSAVPREGRDVAACV